MKIRSFSHPLLIVPGVLAAILLLGASSGVSLKADGSWLNKVPDADRARINPMASQPDAVAAGAKLYRNNCAQCHGPEGSGRGNRPSLRSPRVIASTDGELAWLLRNGNPRKGMPSWANLPEPQRWQIIAYLRTLQPEASDEPPSVVDPGNAPHP